MKGIVFNMLNEMIEDQMGLEVWDALLDKVNPESGGIYTATETYADAELFAYVGALSEMKSIPAADLVKAFGIFSLDFFAKHYGIFFEGKDAKSFLMSVEDVIHVEVRKLHPGAGLPTFEYEDPGDKGLVMHYHSPRKLFDFAEGLIEGVGKHYDVGVGVSRDGPTEQDPERCTFNITFS